MPLQWRLQVLEAQISARTGAPVTLIESDLFRLVDAQRAAALDALTRGDALPFTILGEEIICTGALDSETIASAIGHLATEAQEP